MSRNSESRTISSSASPPTENTKKSSLEPKDATHAIACNTCSTRKARCDRQDPSCSNCIRSNIQCEYRAPLPRGPRKRKYPPGDDLHARLEHYEELLKGFGIPNPAAARLDDKLAFRTARNKPSEPFGRTLPLPDGKVVLSEHGKPRYIENKLWDSVAEEMPHDRDKDPESHEDDHVFPESWSSSTCGRETGNYGAFLLGCYELGAPGQPHHDLKSLYPTREEALWAWDIFQNNVNALSKIIHAPTFQTKLETSLANPTASSRSFDALIFAVCLSAINTVTNEECENLFLNSKDNVMDQFQHKTSRALVAADILRTDDMEVCQAFTLFLVRLGLQHTNEMPMRDRLDLRTTWQLTGVLLRMAMGMGLHRGGSFEKHFKPFELEYRRRLWSQIASSDIRVGELAGFSPPSAIIESDSKAPGNYNDEDLYPDMEELPPERVGGHEMIFLAARNIFRNVSQNSGMGPLFLGVYKFDMPLADRERRINEANELMEQQVLKYCDPLIPLHTLVSAMVRTVLCRLRFKAYHYFHNPSGTRTLSDKEIEICYNSAIKILEYDNFVFGNDSLQGFHWHIWHHYPWDALIYILGELKRRGHDNDTTRAWKQVEQTFNNNPDLIENTRKPLNLAVSTLCLKAWASRETAQAASSPTGQGPPVPKFIQNLRESYAHKKSPPPVVNGGHSTVTPLNPQPNFAAFANASLDPDFFDMDVNTTGIDWSLFQDTLQNDDPAFPAQIA